MEEDDDEYGDDDDDYGDDDDDGYTRLDKIRSEVIRKELEISGIQDVRLKYKQNWINHLDRADNTRLPKHGNHLMHGGR